MPQKKKMGRPTDNPKRHDIKARVDDNTYDILERYCNQFKKNKAEAIRDGIQKLEDCLHNKK